MCESNNDLIPLSVREDWNYFVEEKRLFKKLSISRIIKF